MARTPRFDPVRLRRVQQVQFAVVTTRQAHWCGLTSDAISHRLRIGGPWQRLLPGVYLTTAGPVTQEQREMAALLLAGPRGVITGPAAVRRHRLICAGPGTVDVLVPWDCHRRSRGFVRIRRTRNMPERFCVVRALRYTEPTRAVADAARFLARFDEVRAVVSEGLLRDRCTLKGLAAELHEGGMPFSRLLRRALAEAGTGTRSVSEGQFRDLLIRAGLPVPVFNAMLYDADGTFLAMVDAWWPEAGVAAEVDSREYHSKISDQDATTQRHDRLTAQGVLVLHFPPSRIRTDEQAVLAEIRQALRNGRRRPPLPITAFPVTTS